MFYIKNNFWQRFTCNGDRLVDREAGGRGRPAWWDKYGPPIRTDYRIIVENLSSSVSWQDLKDFMRQAGKGGVLVSEGIFNWFQFSKKQTK